MPFVTPLRPDDPRRVGRYRLAGRIAGQPGTPEDAHAFLARLPDGTPIAVVLPSRASAPDAASRDRFSAEASAARRVAPFCTARILDAGFDAEQPYLVSEFIEGPSLAEVVGEEGPQAGPALSAAAIGAATGLASIHQAGLVHGDFGPDHVVLGPDGPRVVNFSITPPYGAATPSADTLAWARTVMFAAGADGPGDLPAVMPEPLRGVVAACLGADAATRPAARAIVTALLGQGDPAAGLLAEGSRSARAARRDVPRATAGPADEAPPRSASRRLAWAAGFTACLAAIVVAGTLIATQRGHRGAGRGAAAPGRTTAAASTRAASPAPAPAVPATLAGTWSGTVRQTDPELTVTVRVQLTAGTSAGTISYPQLGCSGHLLLVSAAGRTYTLEQGITSGQQNCNDGVVVLTQQSASGLQFSFQRKGAPSPSGVLARSS
jgi:eukaryotic-like serine/threonine-protein kinase